MSNAENLLKGIATFIAWFGAFFALYCLMTMVIFPLTLTDGVFTINGLITTVGVIFSTLISYATLNVLANISLTLKEIKKEMCDKGKTE